MPGLYINDPGATSSLGNILGGLAENLSPQGQARAQLLYQQTGQADVARQQALDVLEARRAAMARVQQWRQVHGANAGGDGSVAGTAASLAAPPPLAFTPLGTATPDLSTFTPDATLDAARIAQGDFGTAEQAGSINLGQNVTRGPGMTDQAIATRSTTQMSPGNVFNVTGKPDVAGSTVMSAGDPAQLETEKAASQAARTDADMRAANARTATDNDQVLNVVQKLHDTLKQGGAVSGVLGDNLRAMLAAHGIDVRLLSTRDGTLEAINRLLVSTVSSTIQSAQGDQNTPIRGILPYTMSSMPDARTMDDESFNIVLGQMREANKRQKEEGGPARVFQQSGYARSERNTYLQGLEAIRRQREQANEAPPPGGGGGGKEVHWFSDAATAQKAVDAGLVPENSTVKIVGDPGPGFVVQKKRSP